MNVMVVTVISRILASETTRRLSGEASKVGSSREQTNDFLGVKYGVPVDC